MNILSAYRELVHAVSTVSDGNMSYRFGEKQDVEEYRAAFLRKHDAGGMRLAVLNVSHEETILSVTDTTFATSSSIIIDAEALHTSEKNTLLFLLTADCLPVVFFDPRHHAIALAHLGTKPTQRGLAAKVVDVMISVYGTKQEELLVYIAPCIQKESYVFAEVAQSTDPAWQSFLSTDELGMIHIDLEGYNRAALVESGVRDENIESSGIDTARTSQFFSHYRAARCSETEGRFATIIGMR